MNNRTAKESLAPMPAAPFVSDRPGRTGRLPASSARVVLLHGLCRTARSMRLMAASLERAGFIASNIGYPSRSARIEELAEVVVGNVLSGAAEPVCFVTHSMGGILVRWYGDRHPEAKIGRVVMLGPPNQGSEVVDRLKHWWLFKGLNGPAGQQLGTDESSVPLRLGKPRFPAGVIAGCVSFNRINSLMIEGPNDGKVSVARMCLEGMQDHIVLRTSHPFIMRNPEAIRQTIVFLREGRFDRESPKLVHTNTSPDCSAVGHGVCRRAWNVGHPIVC